MIDNVVVPAVYPTRLAVVRVLRNVLFPLLMAILAFFVLDRPDQAHELIQQITHHGQGIKFGCTLLSLAIWSYLMLASCRMLLQVSPHGLTGNYITRWLILWIPVLLSALPYLIGLLVLIKYQTIEQRLRWFIFSPVSQLIIVAFIHLSIVSALVRNRKERIHTSFAVAGSFRTLVARLMNTPGLTGMFWGAAIIISVLIIVFFPVPFLAQRAAPFVSSPFVFLCWVGVTTFLGSIVVYVNNNRRRPTTIIAIALLVLSSLWADHSQLDLLPQTKKALGRPSLDAHLRQWIGQRVNERKQAGINDSLPIPLVIVAAEGGGIRAMDWTIEALLAMDDSTNHWFNHYLYAISGVSGGGVGGVFYVANLHDQFVRSGGQKPLLADTANLWKSASQDFLAPVLAGGLYWDGGLWKFFPTINTHPWFADRSKWLANTWGWQYTAYHNTHTLDSSLTSLYDQQTAYNTSLPSLFLNGTLAETGQKAITSNLRLVTHAELVAANSPSKQTNVQDTTQFSDVVDVLTAVSKPIALKTAATLCSRFPIVTNGAWLKNPQGEDIGHVTDGGYFDNSGIETALQLLNALKPAIKRLRQNNKIKIDPYILFVQNSQRPKGVDEKHGAIHFLRGIREPIASLFNPWGRGSFTRDNLFRRLVNERKSQTGYINISLNKLTPQTVDSPETPKQTYPLGWYMNPETIQEMRREISNAFKQMSPQDRKDLTRLRKQLH